MKNKSVDTVTSNEAYVRLRIYDGDLPLDEANAELLRLERAQHEAERKTHAETRQRLQDALEQIATLRRGLAAEEP